MKKHRKPINATRIYLQVNRPILLFAAVILIGVLIALVFFLISNQ